MGLDLVELPRFAEVLARRPRLRERVFTEAELRLCSARKDPAPCLAVRFAAKEAVGKLLGTGVLSWREIEVIGHAPPVVRLHGRTHEAAKAQGIGEITLSLSHSRGTVGAVAVSAGAAQAGGGVSGGSAAIGPGQGE